MGFPITTKPIRNTSSEPTVKSAFLYIAVMMVPAMPNSCRCDFATPGPAQVVNVSRFLGMSFVLVHLKHQGDPPGEIVFRRPSADIQDDAATRHGVVGDHDLEPDDAPFMRLEFYESVKGLGIGQYRHSRRQRMASLKNRLP